MVATPIGNLDDITLRALRTLRDADVVLAEDTRHTQRLLRHHGISVPLMSLHEHNEQVRVDPVAIRLATGASIALVSDAGTPLISDPGFQLVRLLSERGFRIVPIPGPSAVTAALSAAGLPTDRFVFLGFLSPRSGPRTAELEALGTETRTMVFYEAPHRISSLLQALVSAFGASRQAVLARELTKVHEQIVRGSVRELSVAFEAEAIDHRGEFVVLVHGADERARDPDEVGILALLTPLLEEMPLKRAVSITARVSGAKRNRVYELALSLKDPSVD